MPWYLDDFEYTLLRRIFLGFTALFTSMFLNALIWSLAYQSTYGISTPTFIIRLTGLLINSCLFAYAMAQKKRSSWLLPAGISLTIANFILSRFALGISTPGIELSALTSIVFATYPLALGLFIRKLKVIILFVGILIVSYLLTYIFFPGFFFDSSVERTPIDIVVYSSLIIQIYLLGFIVVVLSVHFNLYNNLRKKQAYLQNLAYFDHDTGLPNLRELQRKLDIELAEEVDPEEVYILAGLRLLRLEELGERMGYDTAFAWIHRFATELRTTINEITKKFCLSCELQENNLYRLETSIFAFTLRIHTQEREISDALAQTLSTSIKNLLTNMHSDALVSYYGTFTTYPLDAKNAQDLIRNLINTLHRLFQPEKSHFHPFNATALEKFLRYEHIEGQMSSASFKDEVYAVFQPKVETTSARCCGFEALARWNNPILGNVSPNEFIAVAEQINAMEFITHRILEQTAELVEKLKKITTEPLRVAINLSPTLLTRQYLRTLYEWIVKHDIGQWLEIEITEGILVSMSLAIEEDFKLLRSLGVTFAIDDFGTGYSNLSYLQKFDAEVMKIDKSFIDGLPSDKINTKLVGAILQMSSAFGMKSVAEGVETAEQLEFLAQSGCDQIQGYYFSKPLPLKDTITYVQSK